MKNGMIFNHSHHLLKVRGSTSPKNPSAFMATRPTKTCTLVWNLTVSAGYGCIYFPVAGKNNRE